MVGPVPGDRNLLRQTEGERFLIFSKHLFLRENFKLKNPITQGKQLAMLIKIFLYVIIYPHAIELFMFQKT